MTSGPIVIGPRPAVAGSVLSYSVPKETQAIYVQNYSKLTLLVSFAATAPTATDSLNNQYDGVLAPGGRDTFYVQSRGASSAERSLNAMGAFTGNVWIMPVDRTASQANTGTLSTISDVWLSAYGPYDPPPPFPGGMPLNVDLSSQPRVVTVPMALDSFSFFSGRVGFPASLASVQFGPSLQLGVNIPVSMVFYLYQLIITPGFDAGGAGGMDVTIQVDCQTSGGASVGFPFPITMMRYSLWWAAAAGPYDKIDWKSPYPLGVEMSPPANANHLALLLKNNGSTNAPSQFDYNVGLGSDTSNTNIVPGLIGAPTAGHLF